MTKGKLIFYAVWTLVSIIAGYYIGKKNGAKMQSIIDKLKGIFSK